MSESDYSAKRPLSISDNSTSGRGEKSTISACTATAAFAANERPLTEGTTDKPAIHEMPKYSKVHYDEPDIENQNLCNKRNEKLSKPCKDGFCYCFTSDSDDIRVARHRRNKIKFKKLNDHDDNCNNSPRNSPSIFKKTEKRRATIPFQQRRQKSPSKLLQRKSLNAYAVLEENSARDAPLIHIVQELYENKVVSQVRVNKNKICLNERKYIEVEDEHNCGKLLVRTEKKGIQTKSIRRRKEPIAENFAANSKIPEKIKNPEPGFTSGSEPIQNLSESGPRRRSSEKAGKLLQKRLSMYPNLQNLNYSEPVPPKKPPRQRPLKIENIEQAEKVLDQFLSQGKCNSSKNTSRRTFPLAEKNNIESLESEVESKEKMKKNLTSHPSCPSLSEFDLSDNEVKIGWVSADVMKMLKTDNKGSFETEKPKPEAQRFGWVNPSEKKKSPDKLTFAAENSHLAKPHKLDIDTVDGPIINDHNFVKNMESKDTPIKKELISHKNYKSQASSPKNEKIDTGRSSLREKAAKGTKIFLKTSKQKLVKLVGKSPRPAQKQNLLQKNVSVQTSLVDINDKNMHLDFGKSELFSDESPPGSYHSPGENTKRNANRGGSQFDFSRNIKSPKSLSSNRKLNFSPKKIVQNFSGRNHNTSDQNSGAYRSYEAELNGDLSLNIVNDILLNIKAKLEASDEHAENIFGDLRQRTNDQEQQPQQPSSNVDHSSKNDLLSVSEENFVQINAHADVHNEPIYSEIEEDKILVTGNPSIHSLNDISHYIVNNKDVYTAIKKSPKKINSNKTNYSYRPESVVDNFEAIEVNQDEKNVSYESPAEESYSEVIQSTPNKNTMQTESVLVNAFPSMSEIGYDTIEQHRSTSCPPPIDDVKLNNHNILEDSISMPNNDSNVVKFKPLRYQSIKNKLQTSFRKGKFYFKKNCNQSNCTDYAKNCNNSWDQSNLNIQSLYNESSVQLKLEKTVQLFRSNPRLENSLEAVEAERLLLFSSLKNLRYLQNIHCNENKGSILIKNFKFSIVEDMSNDIFFNYFYIGVFSTENRVKSTSLAVKNGREIVFQNCNILFDKLNESSVIKCDIYILRLRKVLNTENNTTTNNNSLVIEMKPNSAFTSSNELQSRFKLHGSFTITSKNFVPFQFDKDDQDDKERRFCLTSSNTATILIQIIANKTPLDQQVSICGNLRTYFDKFVREGFLNVQDLKKKHNWNRRWCKINMFNLEMWNYPQDTTEKDPIDSFDLLNCLCLESASKEICARPRSFIMTISSNHDSKLPIIFAADNQSDLKIWMDSLSQIIEFIRQWIRIE